MTNTIHVIQGPTTESGLRHGGRRMERQHSVYINGKLYETFYEGSERAFRWVTGSYYDDALRYYIKKLENVLDCQAIWGKEKGVSNGTKIYHA